MKTLLPLVFLCLGKICFGADKPDELSRSAVLILPDTIECRSGAGYYLAAEMGFRWDGSAPLKINIWRDPKSGVDRLMGDIKVFDETGKELDRQFFASIPPMPTGEMTIGQGEYTQLRFFIWNGAIVFPHPGNYYAVATFGSAWTGTTNVQFTTAKRWFKVVEAAPKPKTT